jgi:hypothetical protein
MLVLMLGCFTIFAAGTDGHLVPASLPELMTTLQGKKVTSVQMWESVRRPEILELFRENIYGRTPIGRPANLMFSVTDTSDAMNSKATRKLVTISYQSPNGKGAIHLVLFTPKGVTHSPCFLLICNRGPRNIDPTRRIKSPFWPAEEIVARGYAAAAFCNTDVAPDKYNGFTNGVYSIFDPPGGRTDDSWGAIAAWAWGASRVMDYLETDKDIDGKRVVIVGHSRGGKTALWAGAEDERFAMAVSNDSGSTGAAMARGKQGEHIRDINRVFPHWFCQNYKCYNDRENELPVDQHMLAALIAPRLLYIASATEDAWSDPKSEFATAVEAGPAYQLFGLKGLTTDEMPQPDVPLPNGQIGYLLRTGKHDLTEYDWKCFMDFADKHLQSK